MSHAPDVTMLLERVRQGDPAAHDRLLERLYDELHAVASRLFRSQRSDHTLQPTALVHEAWLKMVGPGRTASFHDRSHFQAVAARAMRQVLINHVRDKRRLKRGGGQPDDAVRITLSEAPAPDGPLDVDVIALHDALEELQHLDERQHRIIELRVFGGLSIRETAEVLDVSPRTVLLDWSMAKAWLARRLSDGPS